MSTDQPTTYRQGCGTHLGMRLHQANGEQPCGECRHGEQVRRLEAETVPLPPAEPWRIPITSGLAKAHRSILADALGITDRTLTGQDES